MENSNQFLEANSPKTFAKKTDNLAKMEDYLQKILIPWLKKGKENTQITISFKLYWIMINELPKKKSPRQERFISEFLSFLWRTINSNML